MSRVIRWGDALDGPVGLRWRREKVRNLHDDQEYVIDELKSIPANLGGKQEAWATVSPAPGRDGECPGALVDAIYAFQEFWIAQGILKIADGVCDPRGPAIRQMELAVSGMAFAPDPLKGKAPEGQADATACWAACYAWWLKATPDQTEIAQATILGQGGAASIVASNGMVNVEGFMRFLSGRHMGMASSRINPGELKDRLAASKLPAFPIIIGFASSVMGGHANVIHAFDQEKQTVSVMECWYPDPAADPGYVQQVDNNGFIVFASKKDGAPFKFKGAHVTRPLSHYVTRPLSGKLLIFPDQR